MIGSMDAGICASECEEHSPEFIKKSDKVCSEEADREVSDLSATTGKGNKEASLEPITPEANRGIGESPYKLNSPPTEVKKAQKLSQCDPDSAMNQDPLPSVDHSSPRTPKDGVFDPFAPGPDYMVFAPSNKKYANETRMTVPRRLNFDLSVGTAGSEDRTTDAESISDEEVFESVYENLLQVIVSNQAEDLVTEFSSTEVDSDGSKTPPSAPCLNGVAETCPGAPIKPTGRSRVIDLELCRKLEF